MPINPDLALSRSEQDEILLREWNMRISTTSPSGRSNVTPLWFVWHADQVWAYCGQKVDNMRRDPRCTVLVDRAELFRELQVPADPRTVRSVGRFPWRVDVGDDELARRGYRSDSEQSPRCVSEPKPRVELGTYALRVRCSTN